MIHRTPSGQVIGSTKPRSQVVDPGCWPIKQPPEPARQSLQPPLRNSPTGLQLEHCQLETLPGFPRTLFDWKKYDGAKALTAILLALATLYFLTGFLGFLFDHTPWLKQLLHLTPAKTLPAAWWQVWKPIGATVGHIASYVDLAFRLFVFLCTYCLAWATFDPRNIEGYVMGFFNTCLGLAYLISPIDAIPDFVPVAGNLDDAVLGVGVLLLGVSSLYRNKLRDVKTKTILELIDGGNRQKALQMLLEDKGIQIKDQET
ncbi:YkvA family protein [Pantanalinema sp. GBBB05]|uniref:YkvA family protein n=1 Tax=Pantanalinema sp. GBBB05 TaxID=2604139 RepID=UPI003D8159D9